MAGFGLAKDEFLPATMVDGKHELMERVGSGRVGSEEVGRGKEEKRKEKESTGVISSFYCEKKKLRVPSYNLQQLEAPFLLFFKTRVYFCNFS